MDEVSVAKAAFAFLLDRYVQDMVPDEAMANYLRLMVGQRMNKKTEEPKAAPPSPALPPPIPAVKQIETGSIEAEAVRHIRECIQQGEPIDRDYLQRLTALPFRQIQALINAAISEKHGIPSTEKPVIKGVDLSDKRRGPRSAATKERMRLAQAARYQKETEEA